MSDRPDIDAMEAAARVATPGPWAQDVKSNVRHRSSGRIVVGMRSSTLFESRAENAHHIATSDPAAVLAMCAYVRRLEARVAELEASRD